MLIDFHDEIARVGYLAPDFKAEAVVGNNQFEEFHLRAYAGTNDLDPVCYSSR